MFFKNHAENEVEKLAHSRLRNTLKTNRIKTETVNPEIFSNSKGLELVSRPYFAYDFFLKKMFLMLYYINLPNFIV